MEQSEDISYIKVNDLEDVDDMVQLIFGLCAFHQPHSTPGDVTIVVEGQTPFVQVTHKGQLVGQGKSVITALRDAIENVKKKQAYGTFGKTFLLTEQENKQKQNEELILQARKILDGPTSEERAWAQKIIADQCLQPFSS